MFDKLWKIRRDGGVIAYFKKRKIRGGGGLLSEIPSVVGVWIFSGTTQYFSVLVDGHLSNRFA